MNVRHAIFGAVALILFAQPALAGACAGEIHDLQLALNAKLDAIAARGKGAPESAGALRHQQPTPNSIAAAEAQAGDMSEADVAKVRQFVTEARKADDGGDLATCRKALADARGAMKL
jgi:hypothetical protein